MTLADAIQEIGTAGDGAVIFARKPWSPFAEAMIASLDYDSGVPTSITDAGFEYFLEAPLITELWDVFEGSPPTLDERVRLALYYAEYDAYPEWVYDRPHGNAG